MHSDEDDGGQRTRGLSGAPGSDYGVHTGPISVDMEKVRQRKRDIVDNFRNGSQARIEKTPNLELIFGEASFSGRKTVAVRSQDGAQRTASAQVYLHQCGHPRVAASS